MLQNQQLAKGPEKFTDDDDCWRFEVPSCHLFDISEQNPYRIVENCIYSKDSMQEWDVRFPLLAHPTAYVRLYRYVGFNSYS